VNADPHPVQYVPYARDPLEAAAQALVQRFSARLPDLTRIVVLLPRPAFSQRLRRHLLAASQAAGFPAVLGPHVDDLRRWATRRHPVDGVVPNDYARELMLVEALQEHPQLFGDGNPWAVAGSLIELFDALTLHQASLPDNVAEFTRRLRTAYGLRQPVSKPLSQEAGLVYTLWHAWHTQTRAEGLTDKQQAYIAQLAALPQQLAPDEYIYFVGQFDLLPAEQTFISTLIARGQATQLLHGEPSTHPLAGVTAGGAEHPSPTRAPGYTQFVDAALYNVARQPTATPQPPVPEIRTRAHAFHSRWPASPAQPRLAVFAAHSPEQEAQAVDIQVRRWLLTGHRRIGIVTDDRRLARRVRALLERAGVSLRDSAGWALSTTSAAAALERWLEAVEEEFHHRPLIDLLRSPFIFPHRDRSELQSAVFRFEQDVVIHENVARGLDRYHHALVSRQRRLKTADFSAVHGLLDALTGAAAPLLALVNPSRRPPARFLDALEESMARLGLTEAFTRDAAGEQLLQVIAELRRGLSRRSVTMHWMEFRHWLGRALEHSHFSPAPAAGRVELLALEQSALARFDALIIAAADDQHLPGEERTTPFFNDAVRAELGLPPAGRRRLMFFHFRRLLEAAPHLLVTHCTQREAEQLIPSPWLALLQSFHRLAYGAPLSDNSLADYIRNPASRVAAGDPGPPPTRKPRPAPAVNAALIPDTVSATAYQQLVDCPYQFYAARCLNLAAPEAVTEKLQKSDYGNHIHRILQAFHTDLPGLPGPFAEPVTEHNRAQAVALLRDISSAVFAADLEDNFLHRGWLRRWEVMIEDYVEWQIKRARQWRVRDTEVKAVREDFAERLRITGRLDRIDTGADGIGIIDYKTGAVPDQGDIHSGEAVQLPFYALLLDEPVTRVEYLCLDKSRMSRRLYCEGDALTTLRDGVGRRLVSVMTSILEGNALPAWGDEQTCEYCAMGGLCRKQAWST
jgi:ATP-dependent helicase/nuclease subunit B